MNKQSNEQNVIDRYHANMRELENEYSTLMKREQLLEEKREDIFTFKRAFREFINDLHDYPPEARQLEEAVIERRQLAYFEEDIEEDIRQAEQLNEKEYEDVQVGKKNLLEKEDSETAEYKKQLQVFHERDTL